MIEHRTTHTYPDAYLEHYADRWIALGLRRLGVTLLQYLAAPDECEAFARRRKELIEDCGPLVRPQFLSQIQRQYEAELQAEQALDYLPRRNGAPFEPISECWRRHGASVAAHSERTAS